MAREEAGSPVQVRDSHMSLGPPPIHHARSCPEPSRELRRQKEQCLNPAMLSFPTSSTNLSFFHYFLSPSLFLSSLLSSLGLRCCARPSLIVASGGCSLVMVHELLAAVASLVEELGL